MYGHIYLNADRGCEFASNFPKHAGLDTYRVECGSGEPGFTIQFLSDDYLKLQLPQEIVFNKPKPPHIPKFFEFVGIRFDFEKMARKRKREREEMEARRPPSPRESWFERNQW